VITWKLVIEIYEKDSKCVMPKTKLNKMAMYPDLWNTMNMIAAKAPFKIEAVWLCT